MNIQIKNRYTDAVIHEGDYVSILEAIAGAIKSGANLSWANLSWANLLGANLLGVDLSGANLSWANMELKNPSHQLAIARTRILLDGDLIGWKKLSGGLIAKLLVPAKAKRSHASKRKCRASQAKVLAIYDGKEQVKTGVSQHDSSFEYRVGRIVKPKEPFSDKWQEECESGIHFYITRIEAENH